jgi:hypothetical protein
MDSDHQKYDRPEPEDDTRSKAIMFLIGALVVVGLLYLVSTGRVEVFG